MNPRLQMILGADMMRAALEGGHDLHEAWQEIVETSTCGPKQLPHVWGGALGILMHLADALQERGLLDVDAVEAPQNAILKVNAAERRAIIFAANQANDAKQTFAIVHVLLTAVARNRDGVSIAGRFTR